MVGLWFLVPAIGVRVPDRQLTILLYWNNESKFLYT
jgi:hypothetical protein